MGSGSGRFTKLAIGLLGTAHPRINMLDKLSAIATLVDVDVGWAVD
ncbi:hypothetical protein BJP36_40930 [Moorena producens JHB]|uniref:Uncharacterized protein n=1 Tax=Moorena producens (strain JHB) TaxID=1454205 RepID=A0A9Q9UVE4_MOOP1|nr:hypothetical protein [Moorena producens]WAN68733.1 hypothetical protein BJP36_40930 [Moorena producens JHB]